MSAAGKKPAAPSAAKAPARTPPQFVYRADTRNPPNIFSNGFSAPGSVDEDNDLLTHVLGGTALRKTGFISTTQTMRVAAAFIKAAPNKPDGSQDAITDKKDSDIKYIKRVGWIYTINTTGLDMVYVPDYLTSRRETQMLDRFGYEQEWAVKGKIPGKNLHQALRVDGYIWRYRDTMNAKQGIHALYPPDHRLIRDEIATNPSYAFK